MTDAGAVRISVVVPIYNPGDGFDDLIRSLDRQTLPRDRFEVILCDDASDADSAARLDEVARVRENVRVLHLPRTGWPGTPRNHGIADARGTYVFFSDQDDYLFDDALEKMCDFADRHSSDVLIAKVVGIGRRIPRAIFRRDIAHAELGRDPILELLTPHKMFRTQFLRDHGIRFPDGKVRLEDHLFVMQAYFAADVISVLASTPCYAWVQNAGSASSSRIDPVTYFPSLEAVLDIVEANTEPGALRAKLLRHWYRGKILTRLRGRRVMGWPADYRETFLDVVTPIAQRYFDDAVEAGLTYPERIRSGLLRAGRRDALLRFAAFEAEMHCTATVTAARWSRTGRLELTVSADIAPPAERAAEFLPEGMTDARRGLRNDRVDVIVHDAVSRTERRASGSRGKDVRNVRLIFDPATVFARRDASLGGRLTAEVRHSGWVFEPPLRAAPGVVESLGRSPLLAGRSSRLVADADGVLEFRRAATGGIRDDLARLLRRPSAAARQLAVRLRLDRLRRPSQA